MSEFANHIPDDMDSVLAQEWCDDLHKVLPVIFRNYKPGEALAALDIVPKVRPAPAPPTQYPANGVAFELTIFEPFTGLEMVRRFGYNPTGWKFNGTEIITPQTKKFMLVSIGEQPNLKAVKSELAQYGAIPAGQWCDAFKKAFPQPDGNGSIGVVDSSWVLPDGGASFPCVSAVGGLFFLWSVDGFDAFWRWLVEMQA